MTSAEKLILDIDPLDPAFLRRTNLKEVAVYRKSEEELEVIKRLHFGPTGRPIEIYHVKLGWIAYPPGEQPSIKIDRKTIFTYGTDNGFRSTTKRLQTNEILKEEEFEFEGKTIVARSTRILNLELAIQIHTRTRYHYDSASNLHAIDIQTRSNDRVVAQNTIRLQRDKDGLIRMKTTGKDKDDQTQDYSSKTTYNYDFKSRIINSITSVENQVATREYYYEDVLHPESPTKLLERTGSRQRTEIRYHYNKHGDREEVSRLVNGHRNLLVYEYTYGT